MLKTVKTKTQKKKMEATIQSNDLDQGSFLAQRQKMCGNNCGMQAWFSRTRNILQ